MWMLQKNLCHLGHADIFHIKALHHPLAFLQVNDDLCPEEVGIFLQELVFKYLVSIFDQCQQRVSHDRFFYVIE